jgi:hypothetical protein
MLVFNLALNMSNVNLSVLEFQIQTQLYSLQGHQPKFLLKKNRKLNYHILAFFKYLRSTFCFITLET